ncbi:MAG: DUF1192 domain-containing protein [Hyphomicrobiaceae bacterium]
MDEEDFKPKPSSEVTIGADLSRLSVDELEARLRLLSTESERVKAEIAAKQSFKSVAQAAFKS